MCVGRTGWRKCICRFWIECASKKHSDDEMKATATPAVYMCSLNILTVGARSWCQYIYIGGLSSLLCTTQGNLLKNAQFGGKGQSQFPPKSPPEIGHWIFGLVCHVILCGPGMKEHWTHDSWCSFPICLTQEPQTESEFTLEIWSLSGHTNLLYTD